MTTTIGEALAAMSRTERLARDTLDLLAGSRFTRPTTDADLGVWFAAHIDDADTLSSGEQTLFWLALAMWNGAGVATVAALGRLDAENRRAAGRLVAEWLAS